MVGEGGIKLSGGQRQRIAIARSIIRKPSILILDEATSAIDVQGEKIVQEALDRVSKHRTTIMIAHRLSTIRKADHIIVLRNGTKLEEGTHEELLSINEGLYKALVQAQALTKDLEDPENSASDLVPALSRQLSDFEAVKTTSRIESEATEMEEGTSGQYKKKSFFTTVGLLLYEQRTHWPWYCIVLAAAMAAGCKIFASANESLILTRASRQRAPELFHVSTNQCFHSDGTTPARCAITLGIDVLHPRPSRVSGILHTWIRYSDHIYGK